MQMLFGRVTSTVAAIDESRGEAMGSPPGDKASANAGNGPVTLIADQFTYAPGLHYKWQIRALTEKCGVDSNK